MAASPLCTAGDRDLFEDFAAGVRSSHPSFFFLRSRRRSATFLCNISYAQLRTRLDVLFLLSTSSGSPYIRGTGRWLNFKICGGGLGPITI